MRAVGKPASSALEDACFAWTWIAVLQALLIYVLSLFWGGVHVLVVSYVVLLLVNATICLAHAFAESRSRNQRFSARLSRFGYPRIDLPRVDL